eukprot:Hpha_TRINITY_DN17179_c0_g1::TRINITY_DN17179_c0_g1_i1::g.146860::m.146860
MAALFAGRFGAIASARRAQQSKQRREAAKRRREVRNEVDRRLDVLMDRFDTNRSGKLEREQVVELLTEFDYTTPPGTAPSTEETDFVMRMADASMNKAINRDELVEAIAVWSAYLQQKERLEKVVKKHDTDQSGALNFEQVKAMLVELNDDEPVEEEEARMVFEVADVSHSQDLKASEVLLAINFWYSLEQEKREREEAKKTQCCIVQ